MVSESKKKAIHEIQKRIKSKGLKSKYLSDMLDIASYVFKNEDDKEYAMKITSTVKQWCEWGIQSKIEILQMDDMYWKAVLTEARNKIVDSYFLYLEKNRDDDKKFYEPRRKKFLQFGIIQGMQDLLDDKIDLLTIAMCPGSGKSTCGIYLLTGVAGWFPNEPNLASAHSGTLTRSFYDGFSQILTDEVEYTWHEIFPNVKVEGFNSKEQTINLDKPNRFKTLTCRAINASLTGATRCERFLYADDLCSGIEEAMSNERLEKLWQTYNTDLKTRKKGSCKEIHIQTRWSVRDVVGRLEMQHEGDPRARFISVPALDENGESNFDYEYGVGFSTEYFLDMKNSMDDVSFRCLYMNQPVEREGLLYIEDELRRYFELPEQEPDAILAVIDTKDKGTDYEFMPVAYKYGNDYYIEDCVYDNCAIEILDEACAEKMVKHGIHMCQVESNNGGGRTADSIVAKMKEKGGHTNVTKRFTTANKETKILVNSPFVKEHFLFKDSSLYTPQSQYGKMMARMCSYTLAGKNRTDDVPDGLAMLSEFIYKGICKREARIIESPF